MLSRILWALSLVCALFASGFYAWHLANKKLFAEYVRVVDAGAPLQDAERFDYYVHYAARTLKNPSREDLKLWWVRAYYDLNPLHPAAADVIRWGSDYRGACGSHSSVLIALLQVHHIESRPLFLLDDHGVSIHTVVEAHLGGRWVVGDPLYGIVFRRRDGQLAAKEDLAADTSFFRAQVAAVPRYAPEYDYDSVTLFNWHKVPVVLPAVEKLAQRIVGEERAKQIARPSIWMKPRIFYSTLFALLALSLGIVAVLVPRKRRGPNPRGKLATPMSSGTRT